VPVQKEDTPYIVRVIESLSLESHSQRILVPTHGKIIFTWLFFIV